MSSDTGIFSNSEAQPKNYPGSGKLASKLQSILNISERVIDFGCGDCFYISTMYDKYDVYGIDGNIPKDHYLCGDNLFDKKDLAYEHDFKIRGQVLSFEVGEHIPKQYEQTFIDNLCRHCSSRLIMSWAIPGQPGIHHVNCQPNNYIIAEIEKRGFKYNMHVTDFLRHDIEMHVRYFKDTLMVFDKTN